MDAKLDKIETSTLEGTNRVRLIENVPHPFGLAVVRDVILNLLLTFNYTILTFMTLGKKAFENVVRKGENAGNQHFFLFPQCVFTLEKSNFIFILLSGNAFNLEKSKILSFVKELEQIYWSQIAMTFPVKNLSKTIFISNVFYPIKNKDFHFRYI